MQKFSSLTKSEKIFRVINLILAFSISAFCIAMLIYSLSIDDPRNRMLSCIAMAVAALVPLVFELIFRKRLSSVILFGYEIYLLFAGVVGSVLCVYKDVYWYDSFVHVIMGYLVSMLGIFLLARLYNYKKLNAITVVIFCLCFSLAIELVWEVCEWFGDRVLNQTAQGSSVPGEIPLVTDTMKDIVCNLSGAVIFAIHFSIGKLTKFKAGINYYEKQLAGDECLVRLGRHEKIITKEKQAEEIFEKRFDENNQEELNSTKEENKNKDN